MSAIILFKTYFKDAKFFLCGFCCYVIWFFCCMIFNYLSEPEKFFAKTVEKIDENGEYVLKTVYLSGDETTGLLFNL